MGAGNKVESTPPISTFFLTIIFPPFFYFPSPFLSHISIAPSTFCTHTFPYILPHTLLSFLASNFSLCIPHPSFLLPLFLFGVICFAWCPGIDQFFFQLFWRCTWHFLPLQTSKCYTFYDHPFHFPHPSFFVFFFSPSPHYLSS